MKEQLLMKVLEMMLNSDGEKSIPVTLESTETLNDMHVGEYVLIRTYSAGVHFGKLLKREGKEALLDEARRIWSWDGAFTLSKVSTDGVGSAKISTKVDQLLVIEAIEIMKLTEKAKGNLYGIQDHNG